MTFTIVVDTKKSLYEAKREFIQQLVKAALFENQCCPTEAAAQLEISEHSIRKLMSNHGVSLKALKKDIAKQWWEFVQNADTGSAGRADQAGKGPADASTIRKQAA